MVLQIGEQHWYVHIQHEFLPDDSNLPRRKRLSWDVVTHASVHTGPHIWAGADERKRCVTGHAVQVRCSKKDNFVKVEGARQALTKAMENFPQELRKQLWQAYWLRVRRPKEKPEKFKARIGRQEAA